ncbi:dTDP-4-dehydrorhamnose 3,5-epimerase [Autumnicola musiva]|uniref:dTDP-4-dehydrorhamnose 3,5-epimerase n=1 Tax=Autumnicola musiva TaxID=3075589 RepID=A0ABU3D841_9FLAO|nr:dTDP-4-dehydrorhamnose 3,5-epimerase [Zunongwangia sp. F117]MDT0677700.1 dTDP-4-dehydrorhamnose 3,5-epimerase [Zunongwangia sp. F117]
MKFIRTEIPEVVICEPKVFEDHRGYFFESFSKKLLEEFVGHKLHFCQDNESKSSYGVLRGLHFQKPPFTQAKLVRVIEGKILDVAVDVRQGSPTFGNYFSIELSSENKKQLFVPRGFAHGFVVLSSTAVFSYKCDNYYSPEHDSGVLYNDQELTIDWKIPEQDLILSEKDLKQPSFKYMKNFDFQNNLYA